MKTNLKAAGILMAITWLTASACQNDDKMNAPRFSYGPEVTIGNGIARSFIRLDDAGTPTDIGFTLSLEGLNNLPDEDSWNVLPLPAEKEQIPYDHISLDWNPHGHVPEGVYNVPHFDMHFYMISQEERAVIEPGTPEMERLPEARFLPVNYTSPPGEGIPQMGKHWTDSTAVEFHGQPFKITYIYGSYDGHVIFHEPMITHDWLSSKRDTLITMPQPEAVEHPGLYPQQYSVDFDPDTEIFTITFRNLTKKE